MKPITTAAVAGFAAGLIPGLALYFFAASGQRLESGKSPAPVALSSGSPAVPLAAVLPQSAKGGHPQNPGSNQLTTSVRGKTDTSVAALEQQLRDRAERLAAAEAAGNEAKSRIGELEAKVVSLIEQSTQAQAGEKSLRQELEAANRHLAVLKADLKTRDARPADEEAATTAQARLLKQTAEAAQKAAARTADLANELEDISRRRETYLNQILSRYREATEMFRAMSLRLDNPRDAGSPLSNDLSRIQQAVQHAEEDMRQLRALNQGSSRVLKEIAAARGKK